MKSVICVADEVELKVMEALSDDCSAEGGWFNYDSRLVEDLGMDSMGLVELVMTLNTQFHIELVEMEVARWRAVKDIIGSVCQCVKSRS